jgi:hypothetical protein
MFPQSHALTTYEQTAIVYRPDTPLEFTTIAPRPLPPYELVPALDAGKPVAILRYTDDAIIQWWPDGLTKVVQADGVQLYFWAKPTMCDAIDYRYWKGAQGAGFFKFNNDGSVYAHCFGTTSYWGPNWADGHPPEIGLELESIERPDGAWDFVNGGGDSDDDGDGDNNDFYNNRGCNCGY